MRKVTIVLGVMMLLLFSYQPVYAQETQKVILDGVYIDSIDVSGMTREQAVEAVSSYMTEIGGYRIQMDIHGEMVSASAKELGLCWSDESVVDRALAFGQSGNIVKRYKAQKDLKKGSVRLELNYNVDSTKTQQVLEEKCMVFDHDPKNASMKKTEDGFEIEREQDGVYLRVDDAKKAVIHYLCDEWRQGLGNVELPVSTVKADHTAAELECVQNVLGSASTNYSESTSARSANIRRAAELINGLVVYPGQEISVTDQVVPFSEENGYEPAPSYESGEVVDSYGGGICQVSTTLYMALIRAEITITERYNHSIIVKYVKPSMDAAIAEGNKDLKFYNNLDHPIYIDGYTDGNEIGFTVYGQEYRPEGREVRYESETLETIEPKVELIASQDSFGTIKQTAAAHTGYEACLWKIVTEDGEETKEEFNTSTYDMTPDRYTVGVRTSDEAAEAALESAIDTNSLDKVYDVISSY